MLIWMSKSTLWTFFYNKGDNSSYSCILTYSSCVSADLGAHWVPALPFSQCSLRHLHVSSCGGANHHFYEVHYGRRWHNIRWVQILNLFQDVINLVMSQYKGIDNNSKDRGCLFCVFYMPLLWLQTRLIDLPDREKTLKQSVFYWVYLYHYTVLFIIPCEISWPQ